MSFFDLSSIRKAIQGLGGQVRDLRGQIEDLKRQRENVANAPVAKSDILRMLEGWVQSARQEYLGQLRVTLQQSFKRPEHCDDPGRVSNRMSLVGAVGQHNGLMGGPRSIDGALCTFLGDQLVAGFTQALDGMAWPTGGLPLAERTAAVQKLDKKIGELQKQEAELVQAAREAGVALVE
jgi:hypothetical protein